jgi:hypothetical protein
MIENWAEKCGGKNKILCLIKQFYFDGCFKLNLDVPYLLQLRSLHLQDRLPRISQLNPE